MFFLFDYILNIYRVSAMNIEHLLQFDVPDGVSTICIGGKIYTKEELEKLKVKKIEDKKSI